MVIDLTKYYKTDKVCSVCSGPLEVNREVICIKCKLKSKLGTYADIIETTARNTTITLNQYLKENG